MKKFMRVARAGEQKFPFEFEAPETPEEFQSWVLGLESKPLAEAYEFYMYAADLKARAKVRPNVPGAIKPVVVVGGTYIDLEKGETWTFEKGPDGKATDKRVDLPETALHKRRAYISREVEKANDFGTPLPKAVRVAAASLMAKGIVPAGTWKDADGRPITLDEEEEAAA